MNAKTSSKKASTEAAETAQEDYVDYQYPIIVLVGKYGDKIPTEVKDAGQLKHLYDVHGRDAVEVQP